MCVDGPLSHISGKAVFFIMLKFHKLSQKWIPFSLLYEYQQRLTE